MAQFAIISFDIDGSNLALYYENEHYRLDDTEFARYLSAVCAGEDVASVEEQTLTLNDVIMLSQKGEELTWADFDNYSYTKTGSGLYIRVYEIDNLFSLMIGGGSTDESPIYIGLVSEANRDAYIDIRTKDVEAFIAEHGSSVSTVGGAELTGIAYQTAYAWANYSEDGYAAMVEWAENRDAERRYGNTEHLTPVVKLDSKAEFDVFYEEMSAYFDLAQGYDEVDAFGAQAKQYTEEFFAEQSLFIAYLEENTSSNRHEVEEVRIENGILEIRICQIAPDSFDTAVAGWFISVAVPKADITDCTGYDAYICATVNPDAVFPSGNLLRTYAYDGDDNPMHTAAVSLYDSGEFIFTFSPISSYFGYGTYTMKDDRLTLQTDDGNYIYVFDIVNDTLVFDGGASSSNTGYSGFTDGAIFD
ncbi:MAG: hypothetical protein Q4D04_14395 [Clostridia bacterium]|nr:hypothetical protein [Clostridia bacterium]